MDLSGESKEFLDAIYIPMKINKVSQENYELMKKLDESGRLKNLDNAKVILSLQEQFNLILKEMLEK